MRNWIATFTLLLTLLCCSAHSVDREFTERFALANQTQREQLLKDLIGGTEDYFYFHCLHYQNTRNIAALDKTLEAWWKKYPDRYTERKEIELREAVLRHGDQPQQSLETLRAHFGFDPDRIVPPAGAIAGHAELPSKLDPADISPAAFLKLIAGNHDNNALFPFDPIEHINAATAAWMIATDQKMEGITTLRSLLEKVERPDVPNLLEAIRTDLGKSTSSAFGYMPVHKMLTLPQLDSLAKSHPKLLGSKNFVGTYLRKLQPSSMDPGSKIEQREAYLKRATEFTELLPPSMVAWHAHLLHHWLELDAQRGEIDVNRLVRYLKTPRRADYTNRKFLQGNNYDFTPSGLDLSATTGLEKLPEGDEALVHSILLTLFKTDPNYEPFSQYIDVDWLRRVAAEAQILAGKGDPERHFSTLGASAYKALLERVDVDIFRGNPRRLAPADEVNLRVDIKNVPKLTVKIFEINALNYFLKNKRDLDLTIDLDGLVPTKQETHDYDTPPAQRVTREFSFPQLKGKRGAWMIEFVGNGTSSRALIRKGELHAIPRSTVAGHAFRVLDSERKPTPEASLWLGGREFKADKESGDILVPYSTKPGRTPFIVTDGELALLDYFEHEAENYKLETGIFIDRESLIAGNAAQVIVRPSLAINGMPADLSLLEEATLTISSVDQNGTKSVERVDDIKLSATEELVHDFVVPAQLDRLDIRIDAQVESLSQQMPVPVSAKKEITVNMIDRGQLIAMTQLLKSGNDYSIEVLGRNGEVLPGRNVQLTFYHSRFEKEQRLDFESDAAGRIFLGELNGIRALTTETALLMQNWPLEDSELNHWVGSQRLHLVAGERAIVPTGTMPIDLDWERYSLLEMRADTPVRDWFKALSVDASGALKVAGLSAGEYRLNTPEGNDRIILVSARKVANKILGTENRLLEPSLAANPLSLAIEQPKADAKKLRLRIGNPSKTTRVHIVASHFVSPFSFFPEMMDGIDRTPRSHWITQAENRYISGREIGDEHRYIIERRDRKRFPGNLLPRPGSILNPWNIGEAESEMQELQEAMQREKGGSIAVGRGKDSRIDEEGFISMDESSETNLDFLTPRVRSFYNLKPGADGVIELDIEPLGDARFIRALAIDTGRIASDTRALQAVRLDRRDRRLQKIDQLDPQGRFTRSRERQVIPAGEDVTIDRSHNARFQMYADLGDAFTLLRAISGDTTLDEFAFILSWPALEAEEKQKLYSEHACHELNLFLFEHDRPFFTKVIQPYLRNKLEKDFIDHYLLGNDLRGFLDEWRFVRLNAAERALLSRRLEGKERANTISSLVALHDSKPVDYALQERLFDSALGGKDLSTDRLGEMAMDDPDSWHSGAPAIRRYLKSIIIPEIDFTEATIQEAVAFLRQQAREHDPRGEGVNIVIKPSASGPDYAALISLQLSNCPLEEALKFTTELAGLKFKVEPNAVVIMPGFEDGGQLITQSFRVPPDFLGQVGSGGGGLKRRATAREILESVGVPFPEGASAAYIAATSELVIRNTASNIDLVEVFSDSLAGGISGGGNANGIVTGDDPFSDSGGELYMSGAASDDPFAGGGGGGGAVDDPFGGGGGGFALKARSAPPRQFYRKLGDTEELAETHYYQLKIAKQTPERVPVNAFWRDYALWDGEGAFLSPHFVEASGHFTEAMLALALLDLPFSSERPKLTQRGRQMTVTAKSAAIVFSEQVKPAALEAGDVVVGQKFYPLDQATRLERGERVPNYIDANFVIGNGYGSHVVATNPTGRHLHFDLLRQLPHGSMPLEGSMITHSSTVDLEPYSTQTFMMGFYFPIAGKFAQYPAQASIDGKVIASTPGKTFSVAREFGEVDGASWNDIALRGSTDVVLTFLLTENLNNHPLDRIDWRMKDEFTFLTTMSILRERQIYHHGLYAFGLMHDDPQSTRQFLLNSGSFLKTIGGTIDSELLTVSPRERRLYQHLEYEPLINARRHSLGTEARIVNEQFQAQLGRLMSLLIHKASPDDDDRLSIVYYLLLQERIEEALGLFGEIDAEKLATRLQYDYFQCYLAFYREEIGEARKIALKYADHPVDRWRQLFAQVVGQADEIGAAAAVKVDDPRDREQQQDSLAANSQSLELKIENGQVQIDHRNLERAALNFYKMDLEFLFSANPFVDSDTERFRFIKPNRSQDLKFVKRDGTTRLPLPAEFRNENVLVEVVGGGQSKAKASFANQLDVTLAKAYGRLQVKHAKGGKPLPKTYVKVYARMFDGEVKFYKDGYTDLRGKFDYASISSEVPAIEDVNRFAILLMHEENGALVEEVAPPNGPKQLRAKVKRLEEVVEEVQPPAPLPPADNDPFADLD